VVLGPVRKPHAQSSQAAAQSPTEQAAIAVVRGWLSGWEAKDPDKVASYMNNDVQYSAYYRRDITERGKSLPGGTPKIPSVNQMTIRLNE
jgi:hypothetical protein